jgi:hypothetical protein
MRILKNPPLSPPENMIARVSYSGGAGVSVVGSSELQNIAAFGPRGISYKPMVGDQILLGTAGGADICLGAMTFSDGIMPGELLLTSSGGAYIRLCSNGDIILNGALITPTGRIIGN